MPCFHPLTAYQAPFKTNKGTRNIYFQPSARLIPIALPCGQCIGCRLARSQQWACRCMHEASLHSQNCFITLTYSPENIPAHGSLVKKHFQDFMKRYRKRFPDIKLRYYYCGEYGDLNKRPHYHACIFGHDFSDKYHWRSNERGDKIWRSPTLEKLWPFGSSEIGSVTYESAAYVARYIVKKQTGEKARDHYTEYDSDTGEIHSFRLPEFTDMSRRPGIGSEWFSKYSSDVYNHDYVVINGKKCPPPRYYDKLLTVADPEHMEYLKYERFERAKQFLDNNTPERLSTREQIALLTLNNQLKRKL